MKLISNSHTTVIEQWRLKASINESALSLAADGCFSSAAALDGSSERALTHIMELREWCAAGETCVTHFYTCLDVYFTVLMHEVWLTAVRSFQVKSGLRLLLETGLHAITGYTKIKKMTWNSKNLMDFMHYIYIYIYISISIGVEKKPDPRLKSHSALEMIYDCKTNFYYCNLLHTCNLPAETKLKFKLGFHGESAACVRCCV